MRNVFILLLSILLLSPLSAQELSSILDSHYKAAAQTKMEKVESIITSGTSIYTMANFKSAFKIYQARPDKIRMETDYQGTRVIQTYNGELAWKYAPAMGIPTPVEITGEERKTLLDQIQLGNRLWNYAEKGAEVELIESGANEPFHLLFTTAKGERQHLSIDRESYLLSSLKTSQLLGGAETEIELQMEGYKTVRGIPFAHRVITKMNGQVVSTLDIEKVEINRKIDPALFEKPSPTN